MFNYICSLFLPLLHFSKSTLLRLSTCLPSLYTSALGKKLASSCCVSRSATQFRQVILALWISYRLGNNMINCSLEDMGLQNSPEKVQSIWHTRFTVSATASDLSCYMRVAQKRSGDLPDAVKKPSVLESQGVVPGAPKYLCWLSTVALFSCFIFPCPHQEIP